ncbi:uncharacterized protein Z520_08996 [Fonsecaea multimorphosa CBS 102226]|uniref:Putative lipoate-protein ligase A n=1 Tax=Fonsecaea multimorphosa CBS 102226 TaxID=1442371 RepID=A0A0D2JY69_9EURO|nr:uncharacterized protein Z520_08996 [Fonsecaea multimorphosa CBS 102226]KIX95479.1 hypothetical protein Z520_08996 [Fonsecaea multimorphosa CBS 102226]OAL21010.1 hypothetical protein AYO22_08430 [Fonsecaea multimorphosa]
MRPAPWLLLTSSTRAAFGPPTKPTKASQANLLTAIRRRWVYSGTDNPNRVWGPQELSRIAQETGPFIFHLTSENPFLNLSIEHFLLTKSHPDSHILLFYTHRPCVVVGRNQNPWLEADLKRLQEGLPVEEQAVGKRGGESYTSRTASLKSPHNQNNVPPEIVPIDLVRRRSGGGTVFHDSGNLNYSVIVPNTKTFKRSTHAEMVVRGLESLASARSASTSSSSGVPRGRYSFGSVRVNERNDIVMQQPGAAEWLKVSGSAYKLTRGRALHHGTLLYSSPYVNKISELLRSPGRGLISAKGVESVRSKVGNLAWTPNPHEREVVRAEITEAITREFWKMYGGGEARKPGTDEITLAAGANEFNSAIASGVQELTSPSWIFEQTPRFEFASGMLENHEIILSANRGVLKSLTVQSPVAVPDSERSEGGNNEVVWTTRRIHFGKQERSSAGTEMEEGPRVESEEKDGELLVLDEEVKLHDVKNWRELLTTDAGKSANGVETSTITNKGKTQATVPDALIQRLEAIFPSYK